MTPFHWLKRAFFISISLFYFAGPAQAQIGDPITEYPLVASKFIEDSQRNQIIVSVTNQNAIGVIDGSSSTAMTVYPTVATAPTGLAISEDAALLFVGSSVAPMIEVFDLNTMQPLRSISLPLPVYELAMGKNNILFATPNVYPNNGIMQIDTLNGYVINEFSENRSITVYRGGLLAISPDRNILYFGNSGISPATLASFDISNPTAVPSLIYRNPHGALGSNGQDIALTRDGQFISFAVGSGNNLYDINKMTAPVFDNTIGSFQTGAYPEEIVYNDDGMLAFTVHTTGQIDVFDANTFQLIRTIPTPLKANELFIDRNGTRLYAAFDDAVRVYSAVNFTLPAAGFIFNDPAMQACFDEQVQSNGWQYLEEITEFACVGRGVVNLDRIQLLPRLRKLDVSDNAITDIEPLRFIQTLRELHVDKNMISMVYALQDLQDLESLYIGDNPLNVYDLTPALSQMHGLISLGLAGLPIEDVSMLPLFNPLNGQPYDIRELDLERTGYLSTGSLTIFQNLRLLNLADNPQLDIMPLSSLSSLQQLNLANNRDIDIYMLQQVLSNNHGLTHLNLNNIFIGSAGNLPLFNTQTGQPYDMQELKLSNTGLDNTQFLVFPNLRVLDISHNNIVDLYPAGALQKLQSLDVSGNNGIQLPQIINLVMMNPGLRDLGLADIPIWKLENLPLFNPTIGGPLNIRSLNLRNTGLYSVWGIDTLANLEKLDLSENNLQDIYPLQMLAGLRELDLSNNVAIMQSDLFPVLDNKPLLRKLGLGNIRIEDFNALPLMDYRTGRPYPLTSLDLRNTGISDINRVEQFSLLEELDLSDNHVFDVFPLVALNKLRKLDLSGNTALNEQNIFPAIENKPNLQVLGLAYIPITDLYLLPLFDYQSNRPYPLQELNLRGTGIQNLDRLVEFSRLHKLDLSKNRISDIYPLGMMNQVTDLNLAANTLFDIWPLLSAGLYRLESLDLSGNTDVNLADVMQLVQQNAHLKRLGLAGFPVKNIGSLPIFSGGNGGPYALEYLNLDNTGLIEINALPQFGNLRELNISNNQISDLNPLSVMPNLTSLIMKNVNASSLFGLLNHTNLRVLDVSYNSMVPLHELNTVIANNRLLRELGLNNIPLNDLAMLQLYDQESQRPYPLTRLDLKGTGLSQIYDLDRFTTLQSLDLGNNLLYDTFPIRTLVNLKRLDLSYNPSLSNLLGVITLRQLQWLSVSGLSGPNIKGDLNILVNNNPYLQYYAAADMGAVSLNDIPMPPPYTFGNNGLRVLDVSRNPLMDLTRVYDYPRLQTLILQDIATTDLFQLHNQNNLWLLDLTNNNQFYCIDLDNLQSTLIQTEILRPQSCRINAVPALNLLSPTNGATYAAGTAVILSASALDTEDGDLSMFINWTSNLSGNLGNGNTIPVVLVAGNHVITAKVTDSRGAVATQTVNITVKAATVNYCTSKGNSTYYEWINSMTLLNQNITTGNNNGYVDRTDVVFPMPRGGSYSLTLNPGFRYGSYNEYWRVWIDLNQDGTFDSGEQVYSGASRTLLTGNLQIPITAKAGKTRMRIVMRYGSYPSACGNYTWGETEDYTVDLQ